ncbi:CPXCG motif-containing cysteine-rich protein [Cryomorpha ignava]|uniref:CPXCG motif-containing cysteine-rich protein n=1 Tax=Cryomorpha ignava TaxID=101383 RepID=A0A7K3WU91_9FLAO|nr:CPXCG motif-containing cysteine-rich protein [Cryomorpha ignava]NEN25118.1 CPXCG motif-containing cysteine-rich protein [Cryomorpha ignava]
MIEHFFSCPYCSESISVLIDTSIHQQSYIEDCEVCCNPMEIKVRIENGELTEFDAQNIGQ